MFPPGITITTDDSASTLLAEFVKDLETGQWQAYDRNTDRFSSLAPDNGVASWIDRIGNASDRVFNFLASGVDVREGSRPTVGSALVGGVLAGNIDIKATPPGVSTSVGSVKVGVESQLSNPQPSSYVGKAFGGSPLYSMGTIFDSKDFLFVSYGAGRLDVVSRSSQYYSGWTNQLGGMPVKESFGGKWSFFEKGSLSLSHGFGGFEVGSGLNLEKTSVEWSIFSIQIPLGGLEIVVKPTTK